MRRLIILSLFLVAFSHAADFSGEWSGTGTANHQKQSFYFVFWEDGTTLNGSGGPDLGDQDIILNGKISGNRISFDLSPDAKPLYHFDLSVDGVCLKGTFKYQAQHATVSGTVALNKAQV